MMSNEGLGKKEEAFIKKVYSDYREVAGILFPHRTEEYSDGSKEMILEIDSVELGRPPETAAFAKPESDEETREWSDQMAN